MLAKITSKNQLTLPKAVIQQMGKPAYCDVSLENGRVILTPVQMYPAGSVRHKLATLGITEQDVADAVSWGRRA